MLIFYYIPFGMELVTQYPDTPSLADSSSLSWEEAPTSRWRHTWKELSTNLHTVQQSAATFGRLFSFLLEDEKIKVIQLA